MTTKLTTKIADEIEQTYQTMAARSSMTLSEPKFRIRKIGASKVEYYLEQLGTATRSAPNLNFEIPPMVGVALYLNWPKAGSNNYHIGLKVSQITDLIQHQFPQANNRNIARQRGHDARNASLRLNEFRRLRRELIETLPALGIDPNLDEDNCAHITVELDLICRGIK